jgi:NADPH:quinone reductase-like Zn-dependent oxidoreductase
MPKASVLTGYGPPDVLVWKETAMPQPGVGQVRIRVRAAGVGPTDAKIRRGDLQAVFPLPADAVLGFEAAGVVDSLGSSVTGVKEGDEVAALLAAAVELASGPSRVITLADELAADLGVMLSTPTPDRAPDALGQTMALLASGALRLRAQRQVPVERAAEAHALLDNGAANEKLILTVA